MSASITASIKATDSNAMIQRALSAGRVPEKPVSYNRRSRRAMLKRRSVVIRPLAAADQLAHSAAVERRRVNDAVHPVRCLRPTL